MELRRAAGPKRRCTNAVTAAVAESVETRDGVNALVAELSCPLVTAGDTKTGAALRAEAVVAPEMVATGAAVAVAAAAAAAAAGEVVVMRRVLPAEVEPV